MKVTTPLVEAAASHDTKFLNVLLGIYRVSFNTLRDIYYLSSNEESGAGTLDLTRKIIEYGVTVEYMIWKGKEKKAEEFQEFLYQELHHEIQFLESIGQDLKNQSEQLKISVEETEREYNSLKPGIKNRKSWAGLSVDKMIEQLHAAGQLKDFDSHRIGQAYVWGCRLNHVSPFVVKNYLDQEDARKTSGFYLSQAIIFSILFHIRMTTRYIDEIRILSGSNVYQELADEISLIYKELDSLEPEK